MQLKDVKVYSSPTGAQVLVLKAILKFALKELLDIFRCYSYTIIRERINLCLLKLQLLKQSVKIHRCVLNTVVVWLHILVVSFFLCVSHCAEVVKKQLKDY